MHVWLSDGIAQIHEVLSAQYFGCFTKRILDLIALFKGVDMLRRSIAIVLFALFGNVAAAEMQGKPDSQRGELLYSTHCIVCHTTRMHWRDKKLARDFKTLSVEVSRWQKLAGLGWNDDDISAVTRYLNALYYRYPVPY